VPSVLEWLSIRCVSLPCPRCSAVLEPRTAVPHPGAPAITAGVCLSCAGLWLDGDSLTAVSPALASLAAHRADLPPPPERRAATCPRCGVPARMGVLRGVAVDVCATCTGVWLDAGEYEAITKADAAPEPALAGTIRCARCGVETLRTASYASEAGFVCGACNQAAEVVAADERARRSVEEQQQEARNASFLWQCVQALMRGPDGRDRL
jgi:Zn-finger nucleic acid-binding protein